MAKMVWKDEYSVGDETLDAQHRQFIELVNRVDGHEPVVLLLEELERYANNHFREEERRLEAVGYPDLAQQKSQHKAFRSWLDGARSAYRSGGEAAVTRRDLHTYLRVWIANHLQVYDAAFRSWLT